jgi:hypothetical protein
MTEYLRGTTKPLLIYFLADLSRYDLLLQELTFHGLILTPVLIGEEEISSKVTAIKKLTFRHERIIITVQNVNLY